MSFNVGRSLRRALQVNAGVVRAIGSAHTPEGLERTDGGADLEGASV